MTQPEQISIVQIHELLMAQNKMFLNHIKNSNDQFTKSFTFREEFSKKLNDSIGARDILNEEALKELVSVKDGLDAISKTQKSHEDVIAEYKKLKTEAEGAIKAAKSVSIFSFFVTTIGGALMWIYHKINSGDL